MRILAATALLALLAACGTPEDAADDGLPEEIAGGAGIQEPADGMVTAAPAGLDDSIGPQQLQGALAQCAGSPVVATAACTPTGEPGEFACEYRLESDDTDYSTMIALSDAEEGYTLIDIPAHCQPQ